MLLFACTEHATFTDDTTPPPWSTVSPVSVQPSTSTATVVVTTGVATPVAATTAAPTTPTPAPSVAANTPNRPIETLPLDEWAPIADVLSPLALPSDCPLPLGEPGLLPNADRSYRGGVHQGIDFVCMEWGHVATSALPGHVVLALHGYEEPTLDQRNVLLDEAKALGFTPASTLQFLFGRFVVIDHGIIPGVGHVISIYAHLAEIDPSIQPGAPVLAGDTLGLIGNSGTETAVTQEVRPQSIHLHWELHINGVPFATGLDERATSDVSARLFGRNAR